jgi:hypothetical protein
MGHVAFYYGAPPASLWVRIAWQWPKGKRTCAKSGDLPFRIDAPIGTEKPIPEIVDYRKIGIGIPVVEKMKLLLSPEPGKSSQP